MTADEIHRKTYGCEDIIALKLKKPKRWNWELTTSKSSPHILLPVIKLYDYRGNLLLETKDTGSACQRKSWHNDCNRAEKQWKIPRESKLRTTQSERRCSDKGDVLTPNKPEASINRRDRRRSDKNNNDFGKTSCENINMTAGNSPKQSGTDGSTEQNKNRRRAGGSGVKGLEDGCLKKSRSDFLWKEGSRHRRTRSDDVFKRKLKYNEEQCYSAGIPNTTSLGSNPDGMRTSEGVAHRNGAPGNQRESFTKYDSPYISENSDSTKTIQSSTHPRYKTRTSSAGTLIISEESFYKPNRRKRHERENTSTDMTSAKISRERTQAPNAEGSSAKSSENEFNCDSLNGKTSFESRRSTLTSYTTTPYRISFPSTTEDDDNSVKTVISRIKWRNEQSGHFGGIEADESVSEKEMVEVCEPEEFRRSSSKLSASTNTTAGDLQTPRKPSQLLQYRRKKRRKARNQRRPSDGSTSSDADNAEWRNRGEGETSVAKGFEDQPLGADPNPDLFG